MKWLAVITLFVIFGILEGSDVQNYEITSAMWFLIVVAFVMAGSIILREDKPK